MSAPGPGDVALPDPASVPRPWLDSWPPGVPTGWTYPSVGVGRLVTDAARDLPDSVALVDGTHRLTWSQLHAIVLEVARGLARLGPDRVILDCSRGLDAVVVALATWRLGAVLEVVDPTDGAHRQRDGDGRADGPATGGRLPDDPEPGDPDDAQPADSAPDPDRASDGRGPGGHDSGHDSAAPATEWPGRAVVVSDQRGRRRHHEDMPVLVADVARLVRRRTRSTAAGRLVGRVGGRVLRARGPRSLSALATEVGQVTLPPVDPDAPALRLPTTPAATTATQAQLVASTFQVRLWIPDMATGSEVVGSALGWWEPGGLVLGILLAALTAGTCQVADAGLESSTVPGATIAFASAATWTDLAAGRRWRDAWRSRRDPVGTSLRLAGVVLRPGEDVLDDEVVTELATSTEGARVRHAWMGDRLVGPLLAQPVYGRMAGIPGALPLGDTVIVVHDDAAWAHGPQVPSGPDNHDRGWVRLPEGLPLDVVVGRAARPDSAVRPEPPVRPDEAVRPEPPDGPVRPGGPDPQEQT